MSDENFLLRLAEEYGHGMTCECGCGQLVGRYKTSYKTRGIVKGQPMRFLRNHHTREEKCTRWANGVTFQGKYFLELRRDHPYPSRRPNYVYRHRLIMEDHLRKEDPTSPALIEHNGMLYLRPEIIVHHRNGVTTDNRIENLELMTLSAHSRLHSQNRRDARGRLVTKEITNA